MTTLWPAALSAVLGLVGLLAAYRLTLHPLSSFPGPKLAAITDFYRIYFDIWHKGGGEIVHHLEVLHAVYGPVVRIGPNTLHFYDPKAYLDIYRMGNTFRKHAHFYNTFDPGLSSFSMTDPREHKVRRDLITSMFQRGTILQSVHVLQRKVDQFAAKLSNYACLDQPRPINLHYAFRAVTVDIITDYSFGRSTDCIETADFKHPFIANVGAQARGRWKLRWMPLFRWILTILPDQVLWVLFPSVRPNLEINTGLVNQIDELTRNPDALKDVDHDIIFTHLIAHGDETTQSLSKESLMYEGRLMVLAGSDTVANTCYTGLFFALRDASIISRLQEELDNAWPEKDSKVSLQHLEQLPYLTAFIKEALRLGLGVITPLERISDQPTTIGGYTVPPNVSVAMGATFVHYNPDIFDDPLTFNPDRWLEDRQGQGKESLDTWLVPFSRGTRMCVWINLAWAELYLILGNVLRKFDFEIHDTSVKDIMEVKDYFAPIHTGKDFHAFVKSPRA